MPDPSLSPAILEARAICPRDSFEIETLQIVNGGEAPGLDICFVVDQSNSQRPAIEILQAVVPQVAQDIQEDFGLVRYALVGYESEANTRFYTPEQFSDLENFNIAIAEMDVIGVQEAAYFGLQLALETLDWDTNENTTRMIVLVTNDLDRNSPNSSLGAVEALLDQHNVIFASAINHGNRTIEPILHAREDSILIESLTVEGIRAELTSNLIELVDDSIFLVNDNEEHNLPLVLGGELKTFQTRGFKARLTGDGENGVQNLAVTIDDIDGRVSRYIKNAIRTPIPTKLVFRVYLSDDMSKPQNDPPLVLYLTSATKTASGLSCRASTIDVVNAPFPNQFYRLEEFSLQ